MRDYIANETKNGFVALYSNKNIVPDFPKFITTICVLNFTRLPQKKKKRT